MQMALLACCVRHFSKNDCINKMRPLSSWISASSSFAPTSDVQNCFEPVVKKQQRLDFAFHFSATEI